LNETIRQLIPPFYVNFIFIKFGNLSQAKFII
jgi:hypothetical protein